jgi:hypothetical protein
MTKTPEQIQAEWDANFEAGQAARRAAHDALLELTAVEVEVAKACGRQRFPTDEELARIDEARAGWDAAKAADQTARKKFKDGVKDD